MVLEIITLGVIPSVSHGFESYHEEKDRLIDYEETAVNITEISAYVEGLAHDLNLTIENTGSTTIILSSCSILVNGTNRTFTSVGTFLHPTETTNITISDISDTGTIPVMIITQHGVTSDKISYVV